MPALKQFRAVLLAVISAGCLAAGTLAAHLPAGEFQRGAAKAAQACEANGFATEAPAHQ